MNNEASTIIDLFAGCGGLSLGLQQSGFKILAAYDNWDPAIAVYQKNFEHEIVKVDLSDVDKSLEEMSGLSPDAIVGGPPCQDYSSAGKRIEGARADLTVNFAEIVAQKNPNWFVMENVPLTKKSHSYSLARDIFKTNGYGLTEVILDASYCGVPQSRKRFFSIGKKGETDGFLLEIIASQQSKDAMTVRDYMGQSIEIEHYYRHPRSYQRRGIYSIDEPSATIRGVNRPMPNGYPGHKNDTTTKINSIRPLTTKERSLIQTFPEDFIWVGTKSMQEQLIGNAVPVGLGRFIGKCIKLYEAPKTL